MGQDPAEEIFVMPPWLREAMAATRGRQLLPDDQIVWPLKDEIFPITAARRKAEAAQAALMASIGVLSADGIFVGQYSPTDRDGNSLGKIFNVFAAPRDLPEAVKYVDTVTYVSELKNWHGFNGTHYANDTEIYAALKDGSYTGGWIIPTLDILRGNLYTHKDKFNVANDPTRAFNMIATGAIYPNIQWSSTEGSGSLSDADVHVIRFLDGKELVFLKRNASLSCRPVRLVPA